MPIPQEKISLVGWASCPSHQLMKRIFARGLRRFPLLRRLCRLRRILLFGSGNCGGPVRELGWELHKIKLIESPNNSCEIYGADLEEVAAQSEQPEAVLAGVRSQKSGRLGRVHRDIWLIVQIGEPGPTSLMMIPRVIQPH